MSSRRPAPPHASDPLRTAFAKDVQEVARLLARLDALAKADERDAQALAALQTECEALNASIDPMDSAAVAVLTAKERQARLLNTRLSSADERLDPLAVELRSALLRAADSQREFLQTIHAALVEEVSAALRPHFREAARARQVAAESDSVRALVHTMHAHWTSDAQYAPADCARVVLAQFRALLDGKQPWRRA